MKLRKNNQNRKAKLATILAVSMIMGQGVVMASTEGALPITPQEGRYGYFVDTYKNNTKENMTPESNPSIGVLYEFLKLWTPGTKWDNGTKLNAAVLEANIKNSAQITQERTAEDEVRAYLDDRRHQSYSVISGLGAYANVFKAKTNAGTSIPDEVPSDAIKVLYNDKGNSKGVWADEESEYGNMVKLVNTLRGSAATTSPAKAYFKYPRPYRQSDEVKLLDTLVPAKKADPSNDGGFPSGHTNAAYLASIALAYATPERYQEMLTRASEIGNDRIIAGMHSCLDVMGGRVMATAIAASVLNDPENAELKEAAYNEARQMLQEKATAQDDYSNYQVNLKNYTERLTYGFEQVGDKNKAMVVPKGAEVLLETRLPYLDANQRRWVLYTTGLPSGYPVLDDVEGWGRLNLFAAANGYGAFETDVIVEMDAAKGGFNAEDYWLNDISGKGKLTKTGDGKLGLNGNNSYTGGVVLQEGSLEINSKTALGKGDVANQGGTLTENVAGSVEIKGKFTQAASGELQLNIASMNDVLEFGDEVSLDGTLTINFEKDFTLKSEITLMTYTSRKNDSKFKEVKVNGLEEGDKTEVVYGEKSITLKIQK